MDPDKEEKRLQHLHELGVLDTPEDQLFRGFAEQALMLLPGTSISAVSLVDANRQWFKTIVGLDVREMPRNVSFCAHTIEMPKVLVVEDATCDRRFAGNPLVTSAPGIRFYAGVKLTRAVGALCVIGQHPRMATEAEIDNLVTLAQYVDIQLLTHGARFTFSGQFPASH